MPKNVVFIHLESVSQMAFWQFSTEMPNLFGLMQRSASFTRFFTASTSSVMSMCDFLFGDSSEMDGFEVFPKLHGQVQGRNSNLFQILHEEGYATYGIQYGSFCLGDAPNNFWGIWPDICGQFGWYNDYEAMHGAVRDFLGQSKTNGKPFALYFWNMSTHLRDTSHLPPDHIAYHEQFQAGYRRLDASVGRLLDDLTALDLWRDTIIVAFGDHGDDLWRHGIYRGRSHLIDPFSTVCCCPLFIHIDDDDVGISSQLVSMVDLKTTLLHMLLPERPPERPNTIFSGINIIQETRSVAFTQSMFALQRPRSDPSKAITKSYAITDGGYRLMVSASADTDDTGGLEFFFEQWDYGNTRNLLDFCRLDSGGNIVEFGRPDGIHPHFFLTFTKEKVLDMVQTYAHLLVMLKQFVAQKEDLAKQHFSGEKMHFFPGELFTHIRKRGSN